MFKIKPKEKAKTKPNNVPLATTVAPEIFGMFEMIAEENNLTKSELLRQIVEQFLKEYQTKEMVCDECGMKPISKTEDEFMFQSGLCEKCDYEQTRR